MKVIFALLILFSLPGWSESTRTLRIFDMRSKDLFESQVVKALKSEFDKCKECSYVNLTNYNEKGIANLPADPVLVWGPAEVLAKETQVLLVNWNSRMNPNLAVWTKYLTALQQAGTYVIFAAGQPGENETSCPLGQTLAAQVPLTYVIGELGERDRLWNKSFYGPEMFTAIRPPKDMIGTEVGPVLFAARWLKNINKRSDWITHLKTKKDSTRKIWLELHDCF